MQNTPTRARTWERICTRQKTTQQTRNSPDCPHANVKWNESGFRPPLCTYRLNWAGRASWGWWDDWDDTVLQTQDSKFEPWRSEAEHATSRSRRLPIILTFTRGWGRNIFVSFKPPRPGTEPWTLACKAAVLTTTLGPPPTPTWKSARHAKRFFPVPTSDCNELLGFATRKPARKPARKKCNSIENVCAALCARLRAGMFWPW